MENRRSDKDGDSLSCDEGLSKIEGCSEGWLLGILDNEGFIEGWLLGCDDDMEDWCSDTRDSCSCDFIQSETEECS